MSLEVKIELRHDARNKDVDVELIEDRIKENLNLHREQVKDVRFSGGKKAGALFLTLDGDKRFRIGDQFANTDLESLVRNAISTAEDYSFANDMSYAYYDVYEA